jgi:hypothetical protein
VRFQDVKEQHIENIYLPPSAIPFNQCSEESHGT